MANDDRQSEQFIREVDEELRRAQMKAVWDRFAPLIIGVCVLVVAITAGYRGWIWWEAREAARSGDRFMAALEKVGGANPAEGETELAKIAADGRGGYSVLAQLQLAGRKSAAGAKAEALSGYDAVAADAKASQSMRDLARIRAALLALDSGDLAGARQRAEPLNQAGSPWRHAAREVLGTTAYQSGELQQARDLFTSIQQDVETPSDMWVRSGMMVSLIDGQLAAPGTETPASESTGLQEAEPTTPLPAQLEAPAATAPAPEIAAPRPPSSLSLPEGSEAVLPGAAFDQPSEAPAAAPDASAPSLDASQPAPAASAPPAAPAPAPPAAPAAATATAPAVGQAPQAEAPASPQPPASPAGPSSTPAPAPNAPAAPAQSTIPPQ